MKSSFSSPPCARRKGSPLAGFSTIALVTPMARGLARSVGRSEAQHHHVDSHVGLIIEAGLLSHQLGGIVDAPWTLRMVFRHWLVGGRPIFAQRRAIDAFRAGVDHALDIEGA